MPDLVTPSWDYAPAPEARTLATIRSSYGLFIGGDFVDPVEGAASRPSIRRPARRWPRWPRPAADVDRAVKAARGLHPVVEAPGAERGKYLYRIARLLQERSRELAVLESIDNGKPIRETRDVDLPLVAAHFFHHAGWADKLAWAGHGPDPQPLGVAGQIIPWNFPLLMLAWKIAPALACRQHGGAQAGRDHAAHRAGLRRDLPAGRAARPASSTSSPAPATRVGAGRAPGRRQGRRSPARPRSARASSGRWPAPASGSRSSSAARPPTSSSTTRRSTRRSRASSTASSSTRATCAAPARGCWCRRPCTTVIDRLKRRLGTLRLGDPLDKNTDIGAINSAEQLDRITALVAAGEAEGASMWQPVPPARAWVVARADRVHRRGAEPPHRPGGDLRPGAVGAHVPHADEAVAKANNTPYGLSAGVWTEKGSRILWMANGCGPGWCGPTRSTGSTRRSPFGGYKESGFGRRRRPPRAPGRRLPAHGSRRPMAGPARRPQDLQALRRRGVPAVGVRPLLRGARRRGRFLANAALASRKDVRDAVVAAREAFDGWSGATAYNRARCSTGWPR